MRTRASSPTPLTVVTTAGAFLLLAALATPAFAQPSDNAAAAEALFREARDLMSQGRFEEACPKLEASQKLDGGYGTLFNLGNCHEQTGRTASAWAAFRQARDLAHKSGQTERVEKAEARASALEPNLVRLRVDVTDPAPGTQITRDGAPLDPAAWATPLPIDPGTHRIVATAPGRVDYVHEVDVTAPGQTETIVVPILAMSPASAPNGTATDASTTPTPAQDEGPSTLRVSAFVAGGVGVVGLGLGTIFGLVANSKWNEALDEHCQSESLCSQAGLDLTDDAKSFAGVSTAMFIVGGVGVAAGAALFVASLEEGTEETAAWSVIPSVGPGEGTLVVRGTF